MAHNIAYGHIHTLEQLGIQTGTASVSCTANAITTMTVTFPKAFATVPEIVIVSPLTTEPYTTTRYVTAKDYTTTGFVMYVYRTNSATMQVAWMAVGTMA